jgi:hypothetical protein
MMSLTNHDSSEVAIIYAETCINNPNVIFSVLTLMTGTILYGAWSQLGLLSYYIHSDLMVHTNLLTMIYG